MSEEEQVQTRVVYPSSGPHAKGEVNYYIIQLNNGDPDKDEHLVLEAGWDTLEEAEAVLKENWAGYADAYVHGCYAVEVEDDAAADEFIEAQNNEIE